jgi:chromosome segregation ATPase
VSLRKRLDLARQLLDLRIRLNAKGEELLAAHAALERSEREKKQLRSDFAASEKLLDDARSRVKDLEKQVDGFHAAEHRRLRVDDQHAQVSALPPALNRDRSALSRLEDDNARLRDALAEAQQRAVELEKQLERNPS